ncbi:MAG: FtsX-like permease family protein [Thiohalomonadaceae bacterium]
MTALDRKLWRDLWQLRAQMFAIMLVMACGVATYIMFSSTLDSLQESRNDYYLNYRFADAFVNLKRAPQAVGERLAEIPGVMVAETRVTAWGSVDRPEFPETITALLTSLPDDGPALLNDLYLREGRSIEPGNDDEVVIDHSFATAHGLHPGDELPVIIKGKRRVLTIVGTAMSPEHIYQLRPGAFFPDELRYAVMWMARTPLGYAYEMKGAFNNVAFRLDGSRSVEEVIDHVDEVLAPYGGLGAYARADQLSHKFLTEEFKQLDTITNIFPVIFLGVAAFLLNIVVNRLVTTQREQVAVLKAFGYSNATIALHYIKLVLVVVAVAVIVGVAAGVWLGRGLSNIYLGFYRLPYLMFVLRPVLVVNATLFTAAAASLGTLLAVRAAARLRPAQAMSPEPPARYRETLFERLGFKHALAQPTRMIFRHIGHRPFKSALTVLGIALAGAITTTGLFQGDTVGYMMDIQYNVASREDMSLSFTEPSAYRALYELTSLPGVSHGEIFRNVPVLLRHEHRRHRTSIRGVEAGNQVKRLLDTELRPIPIPADGVLLTDYLGQLLGVKPGDMLTVEVLEGNRRSYQVQVAGLVKEYLGTFAYMDIAALNQLLQEGRAISGVWLAVDAEAYADLYSRFKGTPRVASVVERTQDMKNFNRIMQETMLYIAFIATVFSCIIAVGVVYNSARIILTERSRELASLRVLGFTRGEISYILLGELALLTVTALPLGLWLGYVLCGYIASTLQNELYRVPLMIDTETYAFSAAVVVVATAISALLVRHKLDKLDLIAVLKTKE